MKGARKKLGQLGEKLAADHLEGRGYVIRQRNYRCPVGHDVHLADGTAVVALAHAAG